MKFKTPLTALALGLLLAVPATAQVGNSFDLGDIIGIGSRGGYNGGYNRGGIDTGAVLGIANILYQVTRDRNNNGNYYPNNGGYNPNNGGYYPNNGGYYPNNGGYNPNNGGYYPNNGGGYYPNNGGYYPGNNRW